MNYAQRLKDVREDRDETQEEVAKAIKTTQQYYSSYERGLRQIPFDRMILLARHYNISLDYFAGLIDEPRKLK